MPPVTILSPYSGRPVVVREQDLGRAIRDDQGKVFYVVEDPEHGRYASMTRKGSDKDLARYRELQAGGPVPTPEQPGDDASAPAAPTTQPIQATPHDATGVKRRNPAGIIVLVIVAIVVVALGYVYLTHPEWLGLEKKDAGTPAPNTPGSSDPKQPDASSDGTSPGSTASPRTIHASFKPHPRDERPDLYARELQQLMSSQPKAKPAKQTPIAAEKPRATVVLPSPKQPSLEADIAPKPVIVAARSMGRGFQPIALVSADDGDRPYADYRITASGLRYKITHHTDGPTAKAGNYVQVRYTAQTLDGKPLIDDGEQSFVLMSGEAIRAFDEGLAGIRAGEQLRLLVPRGHSSAGTLPGIKKIPDAPFLMDVQLVAVKPGVTHIVERPGKVENDRTMPGDTVKIHYVARVEGRDEVIDSTKPRGEPLSVTLGGGEVIPGLELGLSGMRLGETRLMTIPPYLAYGKRGAAGGLIPPNAVLSFRVTLVEIAKREKKAERE